MDNYTVNMVNTEQGREYKIAAAENGDTCVVEYWRNVLSTGSQVVARVFQVFEEGGFTIELTDVEKEQILKLSKIELNEYSGLCCNEVCGGELMNIEIDGSVEYNEAEYVEIHNLLWCDQYGDEYDDHDEERMIENKWTLLDTKYRFNYGCILDESVANGRILC